MWLVPRSQVTHGGGRHERAAARCRRPPKLRSLRIGRGRRARILDRACLGPRLRTRPGSRLLAGYTLLQAGGEAGQLSVRALVGIEQRGADHFGALRLSLDLIGLRRAR
jgi:hypothetical protein